MLDDPGELAALQRLMLLLVPEDEQAAFMAAVLKVIEPLSQGVKDAQVDRRFCLHHLRCGERRTD